jgi:hypothetical protein
LDGLTGFFIAVTLNMRKANSYPWSPTVASKLEKILRKSSLEKFGEDLYKPVIIELDINSSTQAADKIAREILNRCNFVINLLQSLNEK